ncbi:MAG: hypothetical protein KA604_03600 [Candidatus Saccharimonas sp.]|nr:hypothetical protein [Candidatus Saccharimonas sp.]
MADNPNLVSRYVQMLVPDIAATRLKHVLEDTQTLHEWLSGKRACGDAVREDVRAVTRTNRGRVRFLCQLDLLDYNFSDRLEQYLPDELAARLWRLRVWAQE